jgi:hypothetical protein
MTQRPTTKEEAAKCRYRNWAGNPGGDRYNPTQCAEEVPDGGRSVLFHQCYRKPGYGPDELYCKQHAKLFSGNEKEAS